MKETYGDAIKVTTVSYYYVTNTIN